MLVLGFVRDCGRAIVVVFLDATQSATHSATQSAEGRFLLFSLMQPPSGRSAGIVVFLDAAYLLRCASRRILNRNLQLGCRDLRKVKSNENYI